MTTKSETKSVTIQWEKTTLSMLKGKYEESDAHLYAFSRAKNLLFIGMAYKQVITDELMKVLKDNKRAPTGLTIWLGHIVETDYHRITPQIVKDVKKLLVFIHQTPYNPKYRKKYSGRDGIKVRNRKCKLLRPCVRAEAGSVYRTCR